MLNKKFNLNKERIANNWDLFKIGIIVLWLVAIMSLILAIVTPNISIEFLATKILSIIATIVFLICGFLILLCEDASDYID